MNTKLYTPPAGSIPTLPVPAGIREVIGSRLDRLSPACRELLGYAGGVA